MDDKDTLLLLASIAEQQYRFDLLVKLLTEKKLLSAGELDSRFSEKTKLQFSHELLEHLVSTGLKISGSSPSSLPLEPPSAVEVEAKEAPAPKSETNS
jgi:hypothetical protein